MNKEGGIKGNVKSFLANMKKALWKRRKMVSMVILFFLLCISYSLLRNLKDALTLTAKDSGAAAIPFLKVWGMLPGAILGTWGYTKLCSKYKRETVFFIVLSSFLAFFLLFAFVLNPFKEYLHFQSLQSYLITVLPSGFKGFIAFFCNWTCTLFYIISELWSILILSVLFWGITNDITTVSEAKRSYGILNIGSNIAPFLSGIIALVIRDRFNFLPLEVLDSWGQTVIKTTLIITVLGTMAMVLFYWMQKNVFEKPLPEFVGKIKGKKERLSIKDSIRYIGKSRYLMYIATIVLCYNIAVNLSDILWKDRLGAYFFQDPEGIYLHLGRLQIWLSVFATCGALFFAVFARRLRWTFLAMLTPFVMVLMSLGFFSFWFFGDNLSIFSLSIMGITPLAMTTYLGSMQNCLSKAGKYSVFDASKEMVFLPLDTESRLKGKAAIDGLGSGVGKSGASLFYQGLLFSTGSLALCAPFIACILFVIFSSWIYSIFSLGKRFQEKTEPTLQPSEAISDDEPTDIEAVEG